MNLLCTSNKHKINEFVTLFGDTKFLTLQDLDNKLPDPEENGLTYEDNALIKAKYYFTNYGISCISDDSGLEVVSLDNQPGIYSSRFKSELSQEERNQYIVENTKDDRTAYFKCVICYYISDSEYYFFKGSVKGNISTNVSRIAGFGYDPIFIPQGYNQSFSQLDVAIKNQISHRAVAFQKLKKML